MVLRPALHPDSPEHHLTRGRHALEHDISKSLRRQVSTQYYCYCLWVSNLQHFFPCFPVIMHMMSILQLVPTQRICTLYVERQAHTGAEYSKTLSRQVSTQQYYYCVWVSNLQHFFPCFPVVSHMMSILQLVHTRRTCASYVERTILSLNTTLLLLFVDIEPSTSSSHAFQ